MARASAKSSGSNAPRPIQAMAVNWGLLVLLAERAGMRVETANLVGIAAGTTTNFLLSRGWIFRPPVSR